MTLFPKLAGLALIYTVAFHSAGQAVSFTNEVAPIFVQKCLTCHGPEKNKGAYRLDTYESLMKPGSSKEPSISPGHPEKSKLLELITATDEDDRMPKKNEPLSPAEIASIKEWIAEGARFDGADAKTALVSIIPPIKQPAPPLTYPRPAPITALAFSPEGTELAASGYHEITIWDAANGELLRRITNVAQTTLGLVYQPQSSVLACASGTPGKIGEVKLFDSRTGALIKMVTTSADSMLAVAFNPDGTKLAAGGSDNAIRIFDMATGKAEHVIEQHADWVTALAFSHSGELLASASRDKSARLYNTQTGEMEHSYLGHGEFVFGVAFSSDDKRVFSCGRDRKVHIWTTGEAKKEKAGEIAGFEGDVLRVLVSSNSVFACSADHSVRQYSSAKPGELVRAFEGHDDVVYSLAFDEKSQHLATGSFNGKVRVWNTGNGELLLTFIAAPGLLTTQKKN